ncbi:phosphopantetheine-binding protein [Symbioplanes lichenis]|uniref:phosphopantetheine-binding protein n=1 Tax=Symbioplanes lichenis TaxID=1629072 RepID=UPI002738C052|nr:phosphopantetheine-binding protein [Actinoplanes lichenis]
MSFTWEGLDERIARHADGAFDDSTLLNEAGIESLTLLRLAVQVAPSNDTEIDASQLAAIRTVGELKAWLRQLASAPPADPPV